jgi:glycosyltransferase involved in cell wall biosynthesis
MATASRSPRVAVVAAGANVLGGHSVQATALAEGLRREGLDVTPVAINPPFPRGLGWTRRVPFVRTALNESMYAVALRVLRGMDVVHVFSASYWSFLLAPVPAMLAGKRFGARVVLHYHSGEVADHLDRWGLRVHPWLDLADEIVVCSEFQRRAFARHARPARVIPNIVDRARFAFRERLPIRPRLLSNRNLEPYYRVDLILRAFAAIRAARPDATLTIAGAGSEEPRLRAVAAEIGSDGIAFAGAVAPDRMPALLDDHDVLLNASVVDNQPVSLIEAFAAGVAVVSTPTGGIQEMIDDGVTGRLVPLQDPAAMAVAALALLDAPARTALMTRRAMEQATRYDWRAVWPMWRDVYALDLSRTAIGEGTSLDTALSAVGERP